MAIDLSDEDAFRDLLSSGKAKTGKTIPQLAEEMGVTYGVLYNWHEGITLPLKSLLPRIAEVYELDPVVLEKGHERARAAKAELKAGRKRAARNRRSTSPFTLIERGSNIRNAS